MTVPRQIRIIPLVVGDHDEALAWFIGVLGFRLVEDTPLGKDKRWVIVEPPGVGETRLLLIRALTPAQTARLANPNRDCGTLFLHTEDFARDFERMQAAGVTFVEPPRHEPYGIVSVFTDLYGNHWDLIQTTHSRNPCAP